jgi:alanyl aminopeptidase
VSLDPEKTQFVGAIEMALDIKEPLRTLWLNATDIVVAEAALTVKGQSVPAKASTVATGFLALHFDRTIPTGPADLRIRYAGNVRQKDSSGVFRADDLGNHYVLTQFETTYARNAFPCFDEPSYKVPGN